MWWIWPKDLRVLLRAHQWDPRTIIECTPVQPDRLDIFDINCVWKNPHVENWRDNVSVDHVTNNMHLFLSAASRRRSDNNGSESCSLEPVWKRIQVEEYQKHRCSLRQFRLSMTLILLLGICFLQLDVKLLSFD